jgi:hypothetical protein
VEPYGAYVVDGLQTAVKGNVEATAARRHVAAAGGYVRIRVLVQRHDTWVDAKRNEAGLVDLEEVAVHWSRGRVQGPVDMLEQLSRRIEVAVVDVPSLGEKDESMQ